MARFSDAGSVPPLPIGLVGFGGSSLRVGKSKLVLVTFKIGDKRVGGVVEYAGLRA